MKKIIPISLLVIACLVLSSTVIARSTINVPMTDPVYRDLDRILGAGLVKDYIYGQRPYSREEIIRLLTEAQKTVQIKKNESISFDSSIDFFLNLEEVINKRLKEYRSLDEKKKNKSFYFVPLSNASLDLALLDSPARSIPPNNGVGAINAVINPLVQYQGGHHYVEGGTLGLETQHWAQLSSYFSAFAHPRFALLAPTTGSTNGEVIVQELYGKAGIGNFEVEVGRDSLVWGQSPEGDFLLSTNARPLDMIKISNPHPFKFPWIFKHLGNFKGTFFLANLGPERSFKNDFLAGIHLSLQPHPLIELGLSSVFNAGGQGAPTFSFVDGVRDFFGFIPFGGINETDKSISNRISGVEGRFMIPPLADMSLYLEMLIDDKSDNSFKSLFIDGNAYLAGIYLPRLSRSGTFDLRLETKWLSPIFYRHGTFTDGNTMNGLLFGNPLGPDAWSVEAITNVTFSPKLNLTFDFSAEFRESNTYVRTDINTVVSDGPKEKRYRSILGWQQEWNRHWESSLKVGYERANTFNFEPGRNLDNFLGQILLTYHFPQW